MSAISWNPSYPAAGSTASAGDDALRSWMTALAVGIGEMVYFPGSAASQGASTASTGEVRLGTARVVKQPTVTGNANSGYLGLEATRAGLWHTLTDLGGLVGHPTMLENTNGTPTLRSLFQSGTFTLNASSSGSTKVTFATAYNAPPQVFLTNYGTPGVDDLLVGAIPGASAFSSWWSAGDGLTSSSTIAWWSYGTVTI